jgi:hypothetical protein
LGQGTVSCVPINFAMLAASFVGRIFNPATLHAMNAAFPLTILIVAAGTWMSAVKAELAQRPAVPPSPTDAWTASTRYTPRNGYFGDLSLITGPGPRSADSVALARAKERTLAALHEALLAREAAIDARLRDLNAEKNARVIELQAERDAIRSREKQVRQMLDQTRLPETSPSTPPVPTPARP